MAKKITWWQAAEIIGISDRQMRRWKEHYHQFGFRGLFDRRTGRPSPKRVPVAVDSPAKGCGKDGGETALEAARGTRAVTWKMTVKNDSSRR